MQLTATGFDSVQKTIEPSPGPNAITIRVKEVTPNAKVPVVHKHAMGSCDGSLSATLDGLNTTPRTRVMRSQCRIRAGRTVRRRLLQKNSPREAKGANLNFTDKNDNADALFVFHREVEAARKKLAEGYTREQ